MHSFNIRHWKSCDQSLFWGWEDPVFSSHFYGSLLRHKYLQPRYLSISPVTKTSDLWLKNLCTQVLTIFGTGILPNHAAAIRRNENSKLNGRPGYRLIGSKEINERERLVGVSFFIWNSVQATPYNNNKTNKHTKKKADRKLPSNIC